nr:DUF3558 family protein [Micromonospora sp. DSM 115978]
MAANDRVSLPRTSGVLVAVFALAALVACGSNPAAPSEPTSSAPEPTPSRFDSVADVDPCELLTAAEQEDLKVQPRPLTSTTTGRSCSWLAQSGFSLFTVSLWQRSADQVMTALGDQSGPVSNLGYTGEFTPTSLNGRSAFEYRRQTEGMPPGACGMLLAVDDASSVQFEWHAGAPCEGDQTEDHWDRSLTAIEAKLPPVG